MPRWVLFPGKTPQELFPCCSGDKSASLGQIAEVLNAITDILADPEHLDTSDSSEDSNKLEQLKKIGASLDWSRTRFTMDKEYSEAVKKAFLNYYKKGLIYKKERPINWCSQCKTSLSDLELEYKEEKGKLWYIRYPLKNKREIVVATTRPETMLGDTAVAVNPKDRRYKKLIGEYAILPLVNKEIPIIKDKLVDPKFGTGAVKVTPAHDMKDYEISLSHKLEILKVIDEQGKITKKAPTAYQGLPVLEVREKIVKDFCFLTEVKN